MATKDTTRINVPKNLANDDGNIVVRWDGDDPTTYKVTDNHVTVENQYADRFLSIFEGSTTADAAASSK